MTTTGKIWALLVISLSTIIYVGAVPKKRVCIIGAGRSGLAAIKITADNMDKFDPIAFERNSDVGGIWIYRDDPELDEHGLPSPGGIYKHLKTNIPRRYMVYPDYRDFENYGDPLVSHDVFLQYMRNYTDNFQLRKYIQFDTMVTKVFPQKGDDSCRKKAWRMELRDLNTNKESAISCDAVMVCNGHFSKPYIPDIPGMKEFPGKVLHSRSYRKPEDFTNKTVVVLGNGRSADDIARDLPSDAQMVYYSQRNLRNPQKLADRLQEVTGVVAANKNQLVLQDNSTITADTFIFCTGYAYDFPFLDERSEIVYDDKRISPVYKRSINAKYPTMGFIGLPAELDHGRLYYRQSNEFLDFFSGKTILPSEQDMLDESRKYYFLRSI